MKIIVVEKNYICHSHETDKITCKPCNPIISMKPDSAILKNGKHFYMPDFLGRIDYGAEVVVRINRLGKSIPARFAHRYCDAVTVGIDFTARDMQRDCMAAGISWEFANGFDGAAVLGEFRPIELFDIKNTPFSLAIDGKTVQQADTSQMIFSIDEIIAYVSRFCTLKTGDIIFTGTPAGAGEARIGTHLQGCLGSEKVLDFHIR